MKICSNKKEKQPRFLSRFQERQKESETIVKKHRRPALADKASGKNRHGVECSAKTQSTLPQTQKVKVRLTNTQTCNSQGSTKGLLRNQTHPQEPREGI